MPSPATPDRSRTEPTPYELYIRLAELEALWPRASEARPGELVLVCGFQAAELTLRLIEDALSDGRVVAFAEQRVKRYAEHLVGGVELTCELLRSVPTSELAAQGPASHGALDNSSGFRVLAGIRPELLDAISLRLSAAVAGLPFELGIGQELERVRQAQTLEKRAYGAPSADRPGLDYAALVAPAAVRKLREASPCGPEDHLFSTAHQITECWLNIVHHYLSAALAAAEGRRWDLAADALTSANAILPLVGEAGQLLDQMVLADYHPLRVRLRDGSGAQSIAARRLAPAVRQVADVLWEALAAAQLSVLDVLDRPAEHLDLYRCVSALKAAGKHAQSFLFHHYLLTLGVLGTHSLGSLGYEIRELAERAAQPLLPEINQAHHDYVMLSNFEHGDRSGSIVYHNELAHGGDAPYQLPGSKGERAICARAVVEARVAAYFNAIERRDAEAWVALFDPVCGQLHDVIGTRPYLGEKRLRVFINGMFRSFSAMRASCSAPRVEGNHALVDWCFDAVSYHGVATQLEGCEEFLFDEKGHIVKAIAHWQPERVATQWRAASTELIRRGPAEHPRSYIADLRPSDVRLKLAID
ncbi:MAG: nuclear transport factor 2 family protein [Pseudomonadota bacterium]